MRFRHLLIALLAFSSVSNVVARDGIVDWCHSLLNPVSSEKLLRTSLEDDIRVALTENNSLRFLFDRPLSLEAMSGEIRKIYEVLLEKTDRTTKIEKLVEWAKDEERARFVYERLLAGFYMSDRELIVEFLNRSPLFSSSIRMKDNPALLVTQSFEKETPSALITYYFRDPRYSEEAWFNLGDAERVEKLREATNPKQTATNLKRTHLTPRYLDDLYRESNPVGAKNGVYEVKKRGYNLNPQSYTKEMTTVAEDFKEFHSIHSHVVFYVEPGSREEWYRFKSWFIFLNDHYLLTGLEEGLHRNTRETLTGGSPIIGVAEENSQLLEKAGNFGQVGSTDQKWFNIGLRGRIYGKSADEKLIKVGLEGRDFSRKKSMIIDFVRRVSLATAARVWKNIPIGFPLPVAKVYNSFKALPLFKAKGVGLSEEMLQRLIKIYPEITIPLNDFEKFPIYKITEAGPGEPMHLSAARVAEIERARERYFAELRSLADEIARNEKNTGRPEASDDIEAALKWTLTDWAKAAKVSEIFRGY